jgi:hypothetical protein
MSFFSRYTDALRLGTNTFGVNVALRRADKDLTFDCRRCKKKPETLGHELGEFVAGKGIRIQRHKMASIDGKRANIVNVTLRFESRDALAQGTVREVQVLPIVVGSRGAIPRNKLNS